MSYSSSEYNKQWRARNQERVRRYERDRRSEKNAKRNARRRADPAFQQRWRERETIWWDKLCAQEEHRERRRRELVPRRRLARLLAGARERARQKNLPYALRVRDLAIPDKCPVLGTPLLYDADAPLDHRPSLDRTVPELGYVPGNVVVMSFRANTLKSNATAEELEQILWYLHSLVGD